MTKHFTIINYKLRQLLYTILLILLTSCGGNLTREESELLRQLDDSIAARPAIEQRKEAELQRLKNLSRLQHGDVARYSVYDRLFAAYINYEIDSAMQYARLKLDLARASGNDSLVCDALLDKMNAMSATGVYVEAVDTYESIDTTLLSPGQKWQYFNQTYGLFSALMSQKGVPDSADKYLQIKVSALRRLYEMCDTASLDGLFMTASLAAVGEGDARHSIVKIQHNLEHNDSLTIHHRAILYYLQSHLYGIVGDDDRAFSTMIHSAICDISTPVREHKSLYELAAMLYSRGDIERAYRYIDTSLDDLFKTKAYLQMQSIEEIMPTIAGAYRAKKENDRRRMNILLALISVVSVLAVGACYFFYREKRKVDASRRVLEEINRRLSLANAQLNESDQVKELYVGQYINMCSSYLSRVDKYRTHLLSIARSKSVDALLSALKSRSFVTSELQDFYQSFDESFLAIYPNFVHELNMLISEESRFNEDNCKTLNTELRVFALIRLGITDSTKIAEFLRRSVSTIYNYRVKMRNSALCQRDQFEEKVKSIGKTEL